LSARARCLLEVGHTSPKTPGSRSVSKLARASGAVVRKRLLSKTVQTARLCAPLDLLIETDSLELGEPGTKLLKLVSRQFGHGFFDVFDGSHAQSIA